MGSSCQFHTVAGTQHSHGIFVAGRTWRRNIIDPTGFPSDSQIPDSCNCLNRCNCRGGQVARCHTCGDGPPHFLHFSSESALSGCPRQLIVGSQSSLPRPGCEIDHYVHIEDNIARGGHPWTVQVRLNGQSSCCSKCNVKGFGQGPVGRTSDEISHREVDKDVSLLYLKDLLLCPN